MKKYTQISLEQRKKFLKNYARAKGKNNLSVFRPAQLKCFKKVMTHPLSGWLNACEQPQELPGLSAS
jgi:hypothetical protein